jgi:hypothetical protein
VLMPAGRAAGGPYNISSCMKTDRNVVVEEDGGRRKSNGQLAASPFTASSWSWRQLLGALKHWSAARRWRRFGGAWVAN